MDMSGVLVESSQTHIHIALYQDNLDQAKHFPYETVEKWKTSGDERKINWKK